MKQFGSCNGLANFKLNKTKFGWSKEIQFQNRMNQNASFKNILKVGPGNGAN